MRKPPRLGSSTVSAIYTYFGQFIDHDITRDNTPLFEAGTREPKQIVNGGGGRLDLHHIYGKGPRSKEHGHLYDRDKASFLLGKETTKRPAFDLPFQKGVLFAADDRAAGNLILRQVTVLFMRLHNLAVRQLADAGVPGGDRFHLAKEKVVHQYQCLIIKDFLFSILDRNEYRRIWKSKRRTIDWKSRFSIPVEFSHAAFRFGHSMIRPSYRINQAPQGINLSTIIAEKERSKPLPASRAIDWEVFATAKSKSMSIDTRISPPLFRLPKIPSPHGQPHRTPPLPPELPVLTLLRGAFTRLPTGEEVARAFGLPVITMSSKTDARNAAWKPLKELNLIGKTPLWYYILLEAELTENGAKLGRLGSRLVGEVIDGCLRADPDSFYHSATRRSPTWKTPDGKSFQIGAFPDLATFLGRWL
jgi:hypothetical protein